MNRVGHINKVFKRLPLNNLLVISTPYQLQTVRFKSKAVITPIKEYQRLVQIGDLRDDPYQRRVINSLSYLHESLRKYNPPEVRRQNPLDQVGWRGSILRKLFRRSKPLAYDAVAKGIYLYGDVGCGKTMLMDLFYSTVPSHLSKKRIHLHQFMQYVHKRRHEIVKEQNLDALGEAKGKQIDAIPLLAAEIAMQWRVLCFDEFQVTDVADAMLLRRLLAYLLSNEFGVVLFATSNRQPDDLYLNGVQRDSFIPCIKLLKERTEVVFLNSPTDYRKIPRPKSQVYCYPEPGQLYRSEEFKNKREEHVTQWYNYFAQLESDNPTAKPEPRKTIHNCVFNIWGRELVVPKSVPGHVAQFTFKELCGTPLAAGDYLTLANSYKAFIVTDIPYLTIYVRDEVRRFITFLDALYNNNGKLASTAAADFTSLFVEPEDILNDYQLKNKEPNKVIENDTIDDKVKSLVSEHGFSKEIAKKSAMFSLDEERFAFARALSRLSQMSTTEWIKK
ncbi:HHL271Wp [Eremothecium sinecaudum]|uniref:HHL271Wp n=1 Tax=Eremothecium sinecaudum TaxID=45286 RepID=A0A0X8HVX0_9SACH|nr:HHL271Wp [Eremothecium sinecaudum]AMD22499.1 HHL271Wp [Eremothecium sinecaudum]